MARFRHSLSFFTGSARSEIPRITVTEMLEAFAAAHRYADAAAEFQKILEHRGIVGADPIGVLAHLQLGRTFALAGDQVKAT